MGSIRFVPEVLYVLKNFGFDYSVCSSSYVEDSPVSGEFVSSVHCTLCHQNEFENSRIRSLFR